MPPEADNLRRAYRGWSLTAMQILSVRDRLEMIWINAGATPAEMINHKVIGNSAFGLGVGKTVSLPIAPA